VNWLCNVLIVQCNMKSLRAQCRNYLRWLQRKWKEKRKEINESISRVMERLWTIMNYEQMGLIQSYNTTMQTDRPALLHHCEIMWFLQIIQMKKRRGRCTLKIRKSPCHTDSPTAINLDDTPKRLGIMTEQVMFKLSVMGISLFSHEENMIHIKRKP